MGNTVTVNTTTNVVEVKSPGTPGPAGSGYILPIATSSALGGVKVGSRLTINSSTGVLDANDQSYTLPTASSSVLGGVKIGSGLTMDSSTGVLTANPGGYSLPIASSSVLGGFKVGLRLSINSTTGVLDAADQSYTLPPATSSSLGGIIVGSNLSVTNTGVLSANAQSLTPATSSALGGIKVGSNLSITSDGTLSAGSSYSLPIATSSVLGGIKIGQRLTINSSTGVLDADDQSYTLPIATSSALGGIKVGARLTINSSTGVLDANDQSYTLPTATSSALGGVKVGTNLTIDGNGVLSAGPIALTTVQTASSQSAMLALTTQEGDVVVRSDQKKTYMHNGGSAGSMSDFTELQTPDDAVTSVNGQTGVVSLTIPSGNIVDDTSPQLGGNLDVNNQDIVTTSNGNIDLDPNGSGKVVFKGNATKGSGQFVLNCENNSHGIIVKGPPHSAGASYTLTLPNNTGSSSQALLTDGNGVLSWGSVSSLPSQSGNANKVLTTDGTNAAWDEYEGSVLNQTISASKTIPSGNSFVIAGPVTVASGQTLTVSGTMKVI